MSGDRFSSRVMSIFISTHLYKLRRTHRRAVVAVAVAVVVVAVVAAVTVVTAAARAGAWDAVTTATAATTATTTAATPTVTTATTARLCLRLRLQRCVWICFLGLFRSGPDCKPVRSGPVQLLQHANPVQVKPSRVKRNVENPGWAR